MNRSVGFDYLRSETGQTQSIDVWYKYAIVLKVSARRGDATHSVISVSIPSIFHGSGARITSCGSIYQSDFVLGVVSPKNSCGDVETCGVLVFGTRVSAGVGVTDILFVSCELGLVLTMRIPSSMTARSSRSADEYTEPSAIFSVTKTEPIPLAAGMPGDRVVKSRTCIGLPFDSVRKGRTNRRLVSVPIEPSRFV